MRKKRYVDQSWIRVLYLTILQYSSLLDIKQKQANVDESRLARSQVDATAAQGRAIMVFTIFTIIFVGLNHALCARFANIPQLPLSFFTSVFGMNVGEWSDPNHPPPLHRIVNFIGVLPQSLAAAIF